MQIDLYDNRSQYNANSDLASKINHIKKPSCPHHPEPCFSSQGLNVLLPYVPLMYVQHERRIHCKKMKKQEERIKREDEGM